ncbi:carboxylesterase [Rhodanobacter thiooxydans]|uniref:Carboxylesterase n=1 Tax=Rhodanobacter thiooxydans TaxID=416169 RepID=A0A154QKL8_9GAMM|nr:alpha/beta hydrolase fold domain-containing protein [Rhodanobacter thiooxydans]EIL97934.1 putative esterase [Rhodanobacter thiooxydans LCS2]KZC24844.1 carboxylesterase [Rhodanobacter thiooxydans]MCW0203080.1 alpha/beta hydrolase [Rhodanobacter thiooxydans]
MPLPTVEHETGASPRYSILWLHGLGADGNDFAPIVPELVDPAWPALRFVFPHAPVRPVTINNGMSMRAWYDIIGFDAHAQQDEAGIRASIAAIEALIEREHECGVPSRRIFLAGFSQGGAIALAAGLRHTEKLAGIVALSTYLPIASTLAAERSAANLATPIFWGHGTADPVVALPRGSASRDALRALGYAVDWHTYPMAHAVCAEEIDNLRHWLGQRLA